MEFLLVETINNLLKSNDFYYVIQQNALNKFNEEPQVQNSASFDGPILFENSSNIMDMVMGNLKFNHQAISCNRVDSKNASVINYLKGLYSDEKKRFKLVEYYNNIVAKLNVPFKKIQQILKASNHIRDLIGNNDDIKLICEFDSKNFFEIATARDFQDEYFGKLSKLSDFSEKYKILKSNFDNFSNNFVLQTENVHSNNNLDNCINTGPADTNSVNKNTDSEIIYNVDSLKTIMILKKYFENFNILNIKNHEYIYEYLKLSERHSNFCKNFCKIGWEFKKTSETRFDTHEVWEKNQGKFHEYISSLRYNIIKELEFAIKGPDRIIIRQIALMIHELDYLK